MSSHGMWIAIGTAIAATIVTIGMTIYETIRHEKHRHESEANRREVQQHLLSLQQEIDRNKKQAALKETENPKPRRRRTANSTSSVATTETFRTATSNSDSEYYDLSDENSLPDEDVFSRIDKCLEHEPSLVQINDALKDLRRLYRRDPNNTDIVWRLAKACKYLYELSPNDEERTVFLNEGIEVCEQGIALSDPNPLCYKWLAILVGIRCETKTLTQKISDAKYFLDTLLKAIDHLPNDHECHYLHGRYIYDICQLNWISRVSANNFLNNATNYKVQDALECFQLSEQLHPTAETRIYMAKCYQVLKDLESAKIWLRKAEEFEWSTDPNVGNLLMELRSSCLN